MELVEHFMFGPADHQIDRNDDMTLNIASLVDQSDYITFATEFKKFTKNSCSGISPHSKPKFFTYFFLGSLLSLPNTDILQKNGVPKMILKLDHQPNGRMMIKLVYTVTSPNPRPQITLAFRTVIVTNEQVIDIFDINDYAFTADELAETILRFRIYPYALLQAKFDWKILKFFQPLEGDLDHQKTGSDSSSVLWAQVVNHNLAHELYTMLNSNRVGQTLVNFIELGTASDQVRQLFLEPYTLLAASSNSPHMIKAIAVNLVSNVRSLYFFHADILNIPSVGGDSEMFKGFTAGSIAMNFQQKYSLKFSITQPVSEYSYIFFMIPMQKQDGSGYDLNLEIPIGISIVENDASFNEIISVVSSPRYSSFVPSSATNGKHMVLVAADFNEDSSVTEDTNEKKVAGQVIGVNRALVKKLAENLDRFAQNKEWLSYCLHKEMITIVKQLKTDDYMLIFDYLLGQLVSTKTNSAHELRCVFQFDAKHLKDNIKTLIVHGERSVFSLNIIKDSSFPGIPEFLNDEYRSYFNVQKEASIIANNMFHVDYVCNQRRINVILPSQETPEELIKIYSGKLENIAYIDVDAMVRLTTTPGKVADENLVASWSSLKTYVTDHYDALTLLKGFFCDKFVSINIVDEFETRTLYLLETDQFSPIIPSLLENQIDYLKKLNDPKFLPKLDPTDETSICINIISCNDDVTVLTENVNPFKIPIPVAIFDMFFRYKLPFYSKTKGFMPFVQINVKPNPLSSLHEFEQHFFDTQQPSCSFVQPKRKKRDVSEEACLFSWSDIDQFNEEKQFSRSPGMIKVKSDKFFSFIGKQKNSNPRKIGQLFQFLTENRLKLANHVIGTHAKELADLLRKNHLFRRMLSHIGTISNRLIVGIMLKNIAVDTYNGDYKGALTSLTLLGGSYIMERSLQFLSKTKMLNSAFRTTRPFFRRFASGYNFYNLYHSIKSYSRYGDTSSLIGITESSTFLLIDAADVSLELAGLETASSVFGPIGMAIGAVVFIGAEVYLVHEKLKPVNNILHLTYGQKFLEGLYTFVTGDIDQIMKDETAEKDANNRLAALASIFLSDQSQFSVYISPAYLSVNGKLNYADDNTILLDKKVTVKWSQSKPDLDKFTRGSHMLCFTTKQFENLEHKSEENLFDKFKYELYTAWDFISSPFRSKPFSADKTDTSYLCENSIGVFHDRIFVNDSYKNALINLKDGNDLIHSFSDYKHTFLIGDGNKTIVIGSSETNVLIFTGNFTTGHIQGQIGKENVADFSLYAKDQSNKILSFETNRDENHIKIELNGILLHIFNVTVITGRLANPDTFRAQCFLKALHGQGGGKVGFDHVIIPEDKFCAYDINLTIFDNTIVRNEASIGTFRYMIGLNSGSAKVYLSMSEFAIHEFTLNSSFTHVTKAYLTFTNYDGSESQCLNIETESKSKGELHICSITSRSIVTFSDEFSLFIDKNKDVHLVKTFHDNSCPNEIIKTFYPVAQKLNVSVNFRIVKGTTITSSILIGHSYRNQVNSKWIGKNVTRNNVASVLQNNLKCESHLAAGSDHNVFLIDYEISVHNSHDAYPVFIHIFNSSASYTVDLRRLMRFYTNDMLIGKNYCFVEKIGLDIRLHLFIQENIFLNSYKKHTCIANVTLKNALIQNAYEHVTIMLKNSMAISFLARESRMAVLKLKPIIINPRKSHSIIINAEKLEPRLFILVQSYKFVNPMIFRENENLFLFFETCLRKKSKRFVYYSKCNSTLIIFKDFYQVTVPEFIDFYIKFCNNLNCKKQQSFIHLNWKNTRPSKIKTLGRKMKRFNDKLTRLISKSSNVLVPSVSKQAVSTKVPEVTMLN